MSLPTLPTDILLKIVQEAHLQWCKDHPRTNLDDITSAGFSENGKIHIYAVNKKNPHTKIIRIDLCEELEWNGPGFILNYIKIFLRDTEVECETVWD